MADPRVTAVGMLRRAGKAQRAATLARQNADELVRNAVQAALDKGMGTVEIAEYLDMSWGQLLSEISVWRIQQQEVDGG